MYKVIVTVVKAVLYPFYRFRFIGVDRVPEGGVILCMNHTSNIDSIFSVLALGTKRGTFSFMAKAELFKIPLLGRLIKWAGAFPVKRGKNDVGAVKTAFKTLKDGKRLFIFPEGRRVKENEDSEAKTGAGMLALRSGAPVVPVYITSHKKLFRKNELICGEAYYPEAPDKPTNEDYRRVADEIMQKIWALKSPAGGKSWA